VIGFLYFYVFPFSLSVYVSNVNAHLVFDRELLDDTDSRVAYYSSAFLLKARVLSFFPLTTMHWLWI
jgi:hypothetical protein